MPDENPTDAPDFDVLERETVYLMTSSDQPPVWKLADIGRELETHDPESLVRPLVAAGLLYRQGDLVFASPAAFKWVQLTGHVI
ncbi:MAG TPA: hypothetical protein VK790_04270 [Solirubrobacteraceae bacterium]|jgi:hypothetical protein|nr:hypothetical protein [Solirubrobacteraceae bacterium]